MADLNAKFSSRGVLQSSSLSVIEWDLWSSLYNSPGYTSHGIRVPFSFVTMLTALVFPWITNIAATLTNHAAQTLVVLHPTPDTKVSPQRSEKVNSNWAIRINSHSLLSTWYELDARVRIYCWFTVEYSMARLSSGVKYNEAKYWTTVEYSGVQWTAVKGSRVQ